MIDTAVRDQIHELTRLYAGSGLADDFFARLPLPVQELSLRDQVALWSDDLRDAFFGSLTTADLAALEQSWEFHARPKQLPPDGDWQYWLLLAGRGFGKTKAIAEWANKKALEMPGSRGAIVARTAADARDIVVEGESGILACAPADNPAHYEASRRRVTWANGSSAIMFSAEQPDLLRGPQFHWAVCDELAAWRYMHKSGDDTSSAWDMLQFGLRLGDNPQCAIATTPRPVPVIKELLQDPGCVVARGTTYENRSNLAESFFRRIIGRYEGTRLGRQELNAELLDDVPGALWSLSLLEQTRVTQHPPLFSIVVAVDPAASTGQTGIVVCGVGMLRNKKTGEMEKHGFVIEDCTPPAGASPAEWARAAVDAYERHEANAIVAEVNHGGKMVEHTIRTVDGGTAVNYVAVRASQGKYTRAEPVSSLFERNLCHMVGGLAELEDELRTWVPGEDSPNRLDAMVWGFTYLLVGGPKTVKVRTK